MTENQLFQGTQSKSIFQCRTPAWLRNAQTVWCRSPNVGRFVWRVIHLSSSSRFLSERGFQNVFNQRRKGLVLQQCYLSGEINGFFLCFSPAMDNTHLKQARKQTLTQRTSRGSMWWMMDSSLGPGSTVWTGSTMSCKYKTRTGSIAPISSANMNRADIYLNTFWKRKGSFAFLPVCIILIHIHLILSLSPDVTLRFKSDFHHLDFFSKDDFNIRGFRPRVSSCRRRLFALHHCKYPSRTWIFPHL